MNKISQRGLEMEHPGKDNLHMFNPEKDEENGKENITSCCDVGSFIYTTGIDLFKNRYYTLLALATTFITLPHNVVPTILPDHIKWTGGTEVQATASLVVIGAANTFSRLFFWKFSKDEV